MHTLSLPPSTWKPGLPLPSPPPSPPTQENEDRTGSIKLLSAGERLARREEEERRAQDGRPALDPGGFAEPGEP
jgi:hypothetical protein